MDPGTAMLIAAGIQAGGSALSSLMADTPEGATPPTPYRGIADPQFQMEQFLKGLMQYGRARTELARRPFTASSSYAQPVAGTTGVDPAFTNRDLLTVPGADLPDLFPDLGGVYDPTNPGMSSLTGGGVGRQGDRVRPPGAETTGFAVPRGWPGDLPSPTWPDGGSIVNGGKFYPGRGETPANARTPEQVNAERTSGNGSGGGPRRRSLTAPGYVGDVEGGAVPPGGANPLAAEFALDRRLEGSTAMADPEAMQATGAVQLLKEIAGRRQRGASATGAR